MKVLKMVTAAALAAVFILSLCACGNNGLMRPEYSTDKVADFVGALGYGDAENCKNATPDLIEDFSVFTFTDTGKAYAYSDGKVTPLCGKEGGYGFIGGIEAGKDRMIFTYSYEENGKKCAVMLYDKTKNKTDVILTVSDIDLYAVRQTSDIKNLSPDRGIYTAYVERDDKGIGIAVGTRMGTVEMTGDGAEFIPAAENGKKAGRTVSYEDINKVVVTSLSDSSQGATFTDSETVNKAVSFIKSVKTDENELDKPGDYEGDSIVIGLFYKDGGVSLVYIFGGEYIKYGGGNWYKITSGGDISEILPQPSSPEKSE